MQPDGHIALRKFFKNGQEFRIVERAPVHVGIDLHAGCSQFQNRAVDFFHAGGRVIHGQCGHESRKAIRIFYDEFGETIVCELRKFRRKFGSPSASIGGAAMLTTWQ